MMLPNPPTDPALTDPPLPIDEVLASLVTALERHACAVLVAPPGAGKTTRVPLALLADATCLAGRRIIMLEPRRLAARAAAARMAQTLGESVGETVGLRVRFESAGLAQNAHRGRHRGRVCPHDSRRPPAG